MNDQFRVSPEAILDSLGNVIFSPVSEDGRSPQDSPGGPTTANCGPEAARANLSAMPAEVRQREGMIKGTYGQHGDGLSLSADLQPFLESRLPVPLIGSLKCAMTWKAKDMRSRHGLSRLRLLVLTIEGKDCGFLHTPTCAQNMAAPSMQKHKCCRGVVVTPQEFCRRMGYPTEWLRAAPAKASATRSSRKSPRK
jgi:hypothetical protein